MASFEDPRIAERLDTLRSEFTRSGEALSMAYLWTRSGTLAVIAMPGVSDNDQRLAVRRKALASDGVFVLVSHEMWRASAPVGDAAALAQLEADRVAQRIDQRPDREEVVTLWAEDEARGTQAWSARITRPAGAPQLGPWVRLEFTLPRPNFRRYLPEPVILVHTAPPVRA